MEPQNPVDSSSRSSGFFSCSEDCNGVASDSEVQAPENDERLVKNFSVNNGIDGENVDENDALKFHGGDSLRKIEVSGENISLVVDFSGSLGRFSKNNHFEAHSNCPMANLEKENEVGDQTRNFSIGNFVWVLTKSQNWWPGKVTDVRADRKEFLMVSYFGKSHAAWCSPSQLKSFLEEFEKMLNQGKARSFSGAVEKAIADFSKTLRIEMTCSCFSKENRKFGMFDDFSLKKLEPEEFLTKLRNLAKVISTPGRVELTVMQSRVSAFYSSIGHKQMLLDQLYDNSEEQSSRPTKEKSTKKIQEGSNFRKRVREKDSEIRVGVDKDKNLGDIPKMETNVSNSGDGHCGSDMKSQKAFASRERKKSKYLSYPFVNSNETVDENDSETAGQFIGSPSNNLGSSAKRFQKEWFKKFISGERIISGKDELVNVSPADLLSELRSVALDSQYSKQSENFHLIEWFFSKFRISMYHYESMYEMHCENTIGEKGLTFAEDANTDSDQKTRKRKKTSRKSKTKSLSGLSDTNTNSARNSLCMKDPLQIIHPQTSEKSALADTPNEPASDISDFNGGGATLNFMGSDPSKSPKLSDLPDGSGHGGKSGSLMLNFQVVSTRLVNSIPSLGPTVDELGLCGNIFTCDTLPVQKKGKRKRKGTEEVHKTTLDSGIPDLNGTTTEKNFLAPKVKPKQCRRRRKKGEMIYGESRGGTTTLFLKFSPEVSMPSKDDLTSTFTGFGPLNASETLLSEESGGAQVAFMSSADAVDAVKSLEKNNPFGETLLSFRLQSKLATVNVNLTSRMPVKPVHPISRSGHAPMKVDHIRQNLVMMTSMLEKAGNSLSQEMRVKLEGEIKGLLEKVSSMASSSAS